MNAIFEALFENQAVALGAGIGAAALLFILAGFHGYWALGGRAGLRAATPEVDGRPVFRISGLGAFTVMFLLLLGGLVLLGSAGLYGQAEPEFLYRWAPWVLSAVFFLRAVGDFRFSGVFKKVRYTYFAWWDTFLYIPLCLLLSALCLVVALGDKIAQSPSP